MKINGSGSDPYCDYSLEMVFRPEDKVKILNYLVNQKSGVSHPDGRSVYY